MSSLNQNYNHHHRHHDRMERVLYTLHLQVCQYALRKTSRRTRNLAERLVLILAVGCFGVLLLVHWSFVYRGHQGGSSSSTTASYYDAVVEHTRASSSTRSKSSIPARCLASIPQVRWDDVDVTHLSLVVDAGTSSSSRVTYYAEKDEMEDLCLLDQNNPTCPSVATHMEGRDDSNCIPPPPNAPMILYSYSKVKGFLFLSPELCRTRNLTIQHIRISTSDSQCFGEPFLQHLVHYVTGPETVALNWFLAWHDATGYIWNPRTETIVDLEQSFHAEASVLNKSRWKKQRNTHNNKKRSRGGNTQDESSPATNGLRQLLSKLAVVLKTSFLFYITTTLVSFTLRETQERMIDFTHRLRAAYALSSSTNEANYGGGATPSQYNPRPHLPQQQQRSLFPMMLSSQVAPLVVRHLAENLLFVPIMIGMIFFLIEFYRGDKFLAFMVVSLVWLCEVFTVISLRSSQGLHFFPRIFFLLFSLFHFYLFLYPFGFSHTAFASTVLFMMHSMLFFWHRYELPAVANGRVSLSQPRMTMMMGLASPAPPAANTIPSLVTEPPHHHHPHSTFAAAAADEVGEEEEDGSGGGGAEPRRLWANAGARQQQQRGVPMVGLSARRSRVEFDDSYNDPSQQQHPHQTPGSLSRPESSVGLFQEDDSSSYLYYMDGEVVVHRAQHRPPPPPPTAPTSNHQQPLRSFPAPHSPASFSTISAGDRLHQQHLELLSDPMSLSGIPERIVTRNVVARSPGVAHSVRENDEDDPPETSALRAIWQAHDTSNNDEGAGVLSHPPNATPRRDNRGGGGTARGDEDDVAAEALESSPQLRQRRVASAPNVPQLGRRRA